ncbi:DNA-directed RNA polymerase subunit beta [Lacticaseibacillus paracasei]|uniref:DNA-directed RNA polymerase subunit beta n=1 Tax=Lacticaseibacillus paracasei TaxID=1597 RepID=UPI003CFEF831
MENNVPQSRWLYADRGMKKWLGWILSDHSAYLEDQANYERPVSPKSLQCEAVIDQRLQEAWQQSEVVAIQLNYSLDGLLSPDIEGTVLGYQENQVYLQQKSGRSQPVSVEDIRHVSLLDSVSWWSQRIHRLMIQRICLFMTSCALTVSPLTLPLKRFGVVSTL